MCSLLPQRLRRTGLGCFFSRSSALWYEISFVLHIMIDYEIILNLLRRNLRDSAAHLHSAEREALMVDDTFIVFPKAGPEYGRRLSALSSMQYLKRMQLLFYAMSHEQ